MKTIFLTVAALGAAAAMPAFAQQSPATSSGGASQQATGAQQQASQRAPSSALTQDQLKQRMQQAGFESVQVLDAAYLVQARTPQGDTVLMLINPPMASARAGSMGSTDQTGAVGSGSGASGSTSPGAPAKSASEKTNKSQ